MRFAKYLPPFPYFYTPFATHTHVCPPLSGGQVGVTRGHYKYVSRGGGRGLIFVGRGSGSGTVCDSHSALYAYKNPYKHLLDVLVVIVATKARDDSSRDFVNSPPPPY